MIGRLTFMATLAQLEEAGRILRHDGGLDDDEQPERILYLAPGLEWFTEQVLAPIRRRGRNLTPYEQVAQTFYEFVVGNVLPYGHRLHKLDPLASHIWELKTVDVRIFGWFPRRGTFVAVTGAMKDHLTTNASYEPCVTRVRAFRDDLPLDEPKYLTGMRINEIL